jgi:hypothetical protein
MMILLSKAEYDKLVQRATVVEAEVERRVEEEKTKIWDALRKGFEKDNAKLLLRNPYEATRQLLNEILR